MITCVLGTNKKVLSLQSGYPIINKSGGGLIFEHQIILLYYQEFSTYGSTIRPLSCWMTHEILCTTVIPSLAWFLGREKNHVIQKSCYGSLLQRISIAWLYHPIQGKIPIAWLY